MVAQKHKQQSKNLEATRACKSTPQKDGGPSAVKKSIPVQRFKSIPTHLMPQLCADKPTIRPPPFLSLMHHEQLMFVFHSPQVSNAEVFAFADLVRTSYHLLPVAPSGH